MRYIALKVARLYHVADYVVKFYYWRARRLMFTLRSVSARHNGSWPATGLVEKAWKRLDPPTRDHLAERLNVRPVNLSKLNRGKMPMTHSYAERIVEAVRQDDETFTVADLGAPASVVAEADPTVLQALQELATELAKVTRQHKALRRDVRQLRVRVQRLEDRPWPHEAQATGQR